MTKNSNYLINRSKHFLMCELSVNDDWKHRNWKDTNMDWVSDVLLRMRLKGTLYFRTSFTSPWSVIVPPYEDVARFHFAHKGDCYVRVDKESSPVLLEQGDLIIITRGASHTLFCDLTTENTAQQLDKVIEESGFSGTGTMVYGQDVEGKETQLICGHFAFYENSTHPLIEALPTFLHIKNYGEPTGRWLENTLRVIGAEAGRNELGGDLIAQRLSEIIFAQALRIYLNSDGADQPVAAGFANPNISLALTAFHKNPKQPWTLDDLAKVAGMSRTSFVTKFSELISMTPGNYMTHWRMQIACQDLLDTDASIISIAENVGYQSEAAFSRVFKKHFLSAPATFRRNSKPS